MERLNIVFTDTGHRYSANIKLEDGKNIRVELNFASQFEEGKRIAIQVSENAETGDKIYNFLGEPDA